MLFYGKLAEVQFRESYSQNMSSLFHFSLGKEASMSALDQEFYLNREGTVKFIRKIALTNPSVDPSSKLVTLRRDIEAPYTRLKVHKTKKEVTHPDKSVTTVPIFEVQIETEVRKDLDKALRVIRRVITKPPKKHQRIQNLFVLT